MHEILVPFNRQRFCAGTSGGKTGKTAVKVEVVLIVDWSCIVIVDWMLKGSTDSLVSARDSRLT